MLKVHYVNPVYRKRCLLTEKHLRETYPPEKPFINEVYGLYERRDFGIGVVKHNDNVICIYLLRFKKGKLAKIEHLCEIHG